MNSILLSAAFLSLVALEVRADGNVVAFVDSRGVLVVIGDELANQFECGRTGIPGEFRVTAFGKTTVNGTSEVVLLSNSVIALGRGGNDSIRADGNIPGDVTFDGGPGNDRLEFGDPAIEGSALLTGGDGDDFLTAGDTLVVGDLRMVGGEGNDIVDLNFCSLRSRLVIESGSGDDEVRLEQTDVDGFLRIDAGAGADTVRLAFGEFAANVVIVTAEGADDVLLEDDQFGGELKTALGVENDTLSITGLEVTGPASFFGASGVDTLRNDAGNDFASGPPTIAGFEVFESRGEARR